VDSNASVSATLSTPVIPLPFISNGHGTHSFDLTAVLVFYYFALEVMLF
jgi:hypothetical protein